MAGIPARAPACEAALTGKPWSEATIEAAAEALRAGLSAAQRPARIGRIPPRRRRQSGARPLARTREPARCLTPSASRSATTAPRAMSPAARSMSTICPRRPARSTSPSASPRDGHARLTGLDLDRGPRRPGRGRGLHRRRHPRREQCRPGLPRRPALRRGRDPLSRPALVRRRRDQQSRRARRRAAGEGRDRAAPRPRHHRRGARGRVRSSKTAQVMARGDAEAALAAAPHRLSGTRRDGRAGAFLPRRPGRARHAGRGGARSMSSARPSIRARSSI